MSDTHLPTHFVIWAQHCTIYKHNNIILLRILSMSSTIQILYSSVYWISIKTPYICQCIKQFKVKTYVVVKYFSHNITVSLGEAPNQRYSIASANFSSYSFQTNYWVDFKFGVFKSPPRCPNNKTVQCSGSIILCTYKGHLSI